VGVLLVLAVPDHLGRNLPQEISWYVNRLQTGWRFIGVALVLFHFVVPFVLLLSRT